MPAPARPRRRPGEFGGPRKFAPRRKVCSFCVDKIDHVDYKDLGRLRRYLSDRAKIEPRRKTGTCAKHQRSLVVALKRARHLALLPYTAEHLRVTGMTMREGGRPPRGPRPVLEEPTTPEQAQPVTQPEAAAEEQPQPASPEGGEPSPDTVVEAPEVQGARG